MLIRFVVSKIVRQLKGRTMGKLLLFSRIIYSGTIGTLTGIIETNSFLRYDVKFFDKKNDVLNFSISMINN